MVGVGSRAGAAAVVLGGLLVAGCASAPRPLGDPERWVEGECLATLTLTDDASPLAELRELGGWRDDTQERFPAAVIDPAAQRPVSATASLRLGGQPIAWFSAPLDAVVLDGAAFAPLRRADATRASAGQRAVVGRVMPRARQALGDRGVVELLLRVGAIGTYWHLGADLCLQGEREEGATYRASWRGVHHYATRSVQEERLAFAVEIDPQGQVVVIGEAG